MKRFVLVGAAGLGLWAGAALAQGAGITFKPDEVIAARQAVMDLQAGSAAAMKAVVDGGGDVKPLTATAKGLVASSSLIPALFPKGTEQGHNTKAKPEVWSDRAGFEKAAANLHTQAEKLVQLADANDKAGFAAQFQQVGQACGGCHRPYRAQ